jgi:hypothetical protein
MSGSTIANPIMSTQLVIMSTQSWRSWSRVPGRRRPDASATLPPEREQIEEEPRRAPGTPAGSSRKKLSPVYT